MKLIAVAWLVHFQPTKEGFVEKETPQLTARRLHHIIPRQVKLVNILKANDWQQVNNEH